MKLHSNHYVDLAPFSSEGKGNCDGIKITVEGIPRKVETDPDGFEYCVKIGGYAVYCSDKKRSRGWMIFDDRFTPEGETNDTSMVEAMTKEDAINIAEFLAASDHTPHTGRGGVRSGLTLEVL